MRGVTTSEVAQGRVYLGPDRVLIRCEPRIVGCELTRIELYYLLLDIEEVEKWKAGRSEPYKEVDETKQREAAQQVEELLKQPSSPERDRQIAQLQHGWQLYELEDETNP